MMNDLFWYRRMVAQIKFGILFFIVGAILLPLKFSLAADKVSLKIYYWGSTEREKRTTAVAREFEKLNPGIETKLEISTFGDYWKKLDILIAGENMPDIIQIGHRFISQYVTQDTLLPLDSFIPHNLNVTDFGADLLASGSINGKIYAIPLGINSKAIFYNKTLLDQLGLNVPKTPWTWEEMEIWANGVGKLNKGVAGISNGSKYYPALLAFITGRGKDMYTSDRKLGFSEQDVIDFFKYWARLRKTGGTVAMKDQVFHKDQASSMLVQKKAIMSFAYSNFFVGFQKMMNDEIDILPYPKGIRSSQHVRPAMFFAISKKTQNREQALNFIEFFVRSPRATSILGLDRGVPPSAEVRKKLIKEMSPVDRKIVKYITKISVDALPIAPTPPNGSRRIQELVEKTGELIGFGVVSPQKGGLDFYRRAQEILDQYK